jgi:protein TonB
VNIVAQRIEAGALVDPATDSAVSRFREAQAIGAGDPMVRGSRDALIAALLTAADKELEAGRNASARRMVEAAGSVNSSAPGLDIMRRRLEEASRPAAAEPPAATTNPSTAPAPVAAEPPQAAPAASTPVSVVAPQPPAAPAAAAAPADSGVVSALTLRAVRRVEPEYPVQALDRLVSGWVEMEFTVSRDGSVQDVVVIASQPRRTFDTAATAAMRRWRFEPVLRDGQPVDQRASMRMRFTAQDR